MNEGQFDADEVQILREILRDYRAKREMSIWMKATVRTRAFWIAIATAIAGGAKSMLDMLWIKHS